MTVEEFIRRIITFDTVDSILDTCEKQSEKGFIYERLWDICIKFGFCNHFQNSTYTHMTGNVNNGTLKSLTSYTHYLNEKVVSGNSGGCSDISLLNVANNTYTFISSKYPKTHDDITSQKSVDYYDVSKILAVIHHNNHVYSNFNIYLLVPDKKSVLKKVKNANKSSDYITKYMAAENILDKKDLDKCFLAFKSDIRKQMNKTTDETTYKKINYDELYLSPKCNLKLRFHQELITQKTSDLIHSGKKSFLWGCKCRSGKTYMIGGLIQKEFDRKRKLNILIITPAPTETAPQFTDDLFNKFREFDKFKIHHIEGSKNINNIILGDNNIFVVSKQLLQKYTGKETIMKIKNLKIDIIGFDENHFSGTTELSKSILDSYEWADWTVKVYLTATFKKPLQEWGISQECQMYWDIEDEQICKSILNTQSEQDIDKLRKKHGVANVDSTIKHFRDSGSSNNDIFKPYEKMPDLSLITTMFDSERYDIIKNKIMGSKYGFCFDVLFALNNQKTQFQFEDDVKTVLRFVSGSNKEVDYKNGDKSMFSRIAKICSNKESRVPFTQIWFLPSDNINEVSVCLEKLMKEDGVLKKYNVLCINRKNKDIAKDIKDEITNQEKLAKAEGKSGLILLAGNMLTLGITLNLCDVVILMNNALSSDKVLQQMYRCMTEGTDVSNKKFGFVIDLNISRVINTCINYTIYSKDKSIEDKIKYLIENHLINIDLDMMENKKINSDAIVSKLMDIWKSDPINSFKSLLRNLDNDYVDFDTSTQKLINNSFSKCLKEDMINTTIELKDIGDESQKLPSGKEVIGDGEPVSDVINDEEIQISFTKDVLPYIIPLACILTIKNTNKDFVNMLNDIQANPELLDIFDDMCLIWWNKKGLLDIIKNIVAKYFDRNSNTFNISINFKMSLHSLIDSPKELLELINGCLKPKLKEKQENGEVFTPMCEVNEQLDKLDTYYTKLHKKSIFAEKGFKWFDPAVGMGNFLVAVYLRLMTGLTKEIPDEKNRKKHIIEKMLYMSELNKKNCYMVKQIFNVNNEYKLNLHEGDTLELDICKKWNLKQDLKIHDFGFDVILGNPPFNKGGIRSHTGKQLGEKNETIWPKFIEQAFQYLKHGGFIVFINPLSWLKKSHTLHNVMLEKHIVWMKLWDNSQAKNCMDADIPTSLYILHNIANTVPKNTTEIISIMKRRNLTTVSNEYLNHVYSIPLAYHNIFNKLLRFIETKGLKLDYNTKTVKSTGTKCKIPANYKQTDMWAIDTYTIKDGLMVKKAIEAHPDMGKRKLIIANKASFAGAFIDEGVLNLTGNHKFYIVGDNLELLHKMLDFKIMNVIGHFTKYGQDFLDSEAFVYIPDIRKLGMAHITESELYRLIGLTDSEIKTFQKYVEG